MSGSIESNTEENLHFETVYENIFEKCDVNLTGQVKTMDLVQVVKNEMSQSNLSERQLKIHLEDLTRRLDPKKDDGYVDKTTFVEQAVEWMHSVMEKSNNNSVSSSLASIASQPEFEEVSILNHTYGSIELVNGASFSIEKERQSFVELQEEVIELRKQIKIMTDEKNQIFNQLNQTEDINSALQAKNVDNESRIQNLKTSLDNALKYQKELEDMKNPIEENNSSYWQDTSIRRVSQLATKNAELENELSETRDQLNSVLSDLDNAKKNHNSTIGKLKEDKKKAEEQLNETIAINIELESRIEELKSENSNIRESQFFQKTPPMYGADRESDFFQPSFDEYDDPFAVNQNPDDIGPTANSTPFLRRRSKISTRGSIGDEIKGVVGATKCLPLCEKSAHLNDSKYVETKDGQSQTSLSDILKSITEYYSWKPVAIGFVVLLTMAIFTFTFFGAVEFEDGRKLMPIFWSSWMPEPFTLIKFENVPPHVW